MKTLKKNWTAIALAATIPLALAMPVVAEDRPSPQAVFADWDLDGDGAVTRAELAAHDAGRFDRADTDGDGALDSAELLARGQTRVETRIDRMLARADADGDGRLTEAEIAQVRDHRRGPSPDRVFDRMDADGDGRITGAEFQAAADRFMDRRG